MNPELRQTLQSITRNLESANEAAQENIYTFTQLYIDPCLSGIKGCLEDCTAPCFPGRDEQQRRRRGRSRGRAELNFDFYDDWDEDEDSGSNLMGWGNDELDSLLAGSSRQDRRGGPPRRQRAMSYGSRGKAKQVSAHNDGEEDPTIIPSSSYLGFLERLPFKFGSKLRYKPSAADLQENPGGLKRTGLEDEALLEVSDESDGDVLLTQGRQRSATAASLSTTNSLSSRGDLIPSDEEADAVPLDDEFAMVLERRNTGTTSEDHSSGRSRSSGKPQMSRTSTRTPSSLSAKNSSGTRRATSTMSPQGSEQTTAPPFLSLAELHKEEGQTKAEEESEVSMKREVPQKLALEHGVNSTGEERSALPLVQDSTDPQKQPLLADSNNGVERRGDKDSQTSSKNASSRMVDQP